MKKMEFEIKEVHHIDDTTTTTSPIDDLVARVTTYERRQGESSEMTTFKV